MGIPRAESTHNRSDRGRLLAAALLCATIGGCAAPVGQNWADFRSSRQIDAMAADDSFPSAAELGLAMSDDAEREGS